LALWRTSRWEGLLLALLAVSIVANVAASPYYLGVQNLINLFQLSIEKVIVALTMTLVIINGEIDLSVASVMGLSACLMAWLFQMGVPIAVGIMAALAVGCLAGAINGFFITYVGLPSLVVTLAGLIGYRGIAEIFLEDRSIRNFPDWFNAIGQHPIVGPFTASLLIFFVLFVVVAVVLHGSALGRLIYVMGNGIEVARYSGVRVRRIKILLFAASGSVAALAGILYAARLGSVRGDIAQGFELNVVTIVLLGGVSVFGGSGGILGVGLSILLILNLQNGMGLANITGDVQTSVIGALLILSVLVPNILRSIVSRYKGREI